MKARITQAVCTFSLLAAAACDPMEEAAEQAPVEKSDVGYMAQLLITPNAIAGEYIVKFRDDVKAVGLRRAGEVTREMVGTSGQVMYVYEGAVKGFAARLSEAQMRRLLADPRVERIETNARVYAVGVQSPTPSWGLDRIDQRDLPLDSSYNDPNDGAGVHAYIVDTGVLLTHQDFAGRIGNGFDAVTAGGNANDCNGHGTHVAGTVGGTVYGVAKRVTIHAVRVLDCNGSGTTAGVINGVNWVTTNHIKPAVANMSLGGGASQTLDDAVANSIAAGVTYALAAGNSNADACTSSPARTPAAITVGATQNNDARASYSNFGTCVDIFAPGTNITSAWHTSTAATNTISGTSMASPHVAGAAALYLSANPSATPQQVRDALVNNATPSKVTSPGTGSPNRLLYVSFIGGGGTPPPTDTIPPSTSITSPTAGSTLSGTTTISASASDNVGVTQVDFYVGSALIGSDTTSPYSISWNTTSSANGSYSLTTRARDAAGNVATSVAIPVTVSNSTGSCTTSSQLLLNPGFESGNVNWTATAGVISTTSGARTGIYQAWLGGYGRVATDTAYQDVTIPSTACGATLSLWTRITTAETGTTPYDYLRIQVRNSSNGVVATLGTYSNATSNATWTQRSFNVSAYRGQTIRVYFEATEDLSLATSFYIDDAALTITQ
jgi:subtilisin family serine protease